MKWFVAVFLYTLYEGIICQLQSKPDGNCANDRRNHHVAHIQKLDVKCEKDGIIVDVEFAEPFQGVIYSKGHFRNPECRYVMANSNLNRYHFIVPMTGCGTSSEINGNFGFYNILIFQNDNIVQEVWDIARKISCEWESKFEKRVMFNPISVNMIDVEEVRVIAEDVTCWMDIKRGKGPFAPSLTSSVMAGEQLSIVIYIGDKKGHFDMLVKGCVASDNKDVDNVKTNIIQLTDDKGCSLKPKIFNNFEKTRETGNTGASIISFATFNSFRFPDSNELYFSCDVELCKHECSPTCEEPGRPSIFVTVKSELCGPGHTHPLCKTLPSITKLKTPIIGEITTKSTTYSDFTKKISEITFPTFPVTKSTPSKISLITPKITTKVKTILRTTLPDETRKHVITTTKQPTASQIIQHIETSTVRKTTTTTTKRPTTTFAAKITSDTKATTTSAKARSTTAATTRTIITTKKRPLTTFAPRITSDTKATTTSAKTRSVATFTKLPITTVAQKTPTITKRPTTASIRQPTKTATKRTRSTITTLPTASTTKSQTEITTRRPVCRPGDTSLDCLTPLPDILREFICKEDSTDVRCLQKPTSVKPEWTGDSRYHAFHAYLYQKAPRPRSGDFRRFSRSLSARNTTGDSQHLWNINLTKGYTTDSSNI